MRLTLKKNNRNIFLMNTKWMKISITFQHDPHHFQCRSITASQMSGFARKKKKKETFLTDHVANYA